MARKLLDLFDTLVLIKLVPLGSHEIFNCKVGVAKTVEVNLVFVLLLLNV
jgi:hypothetical protein